MKITSINTLNVAGHTFTTLTFDKPAPVSLWDIVLIDGKQYVPVFESNLPSNMLTFDEDISVSVNQHTLEFVRL